MAPSYMASVAALAGIASPATAFTSGNLRSHAANSPQTQQAANQAPTVSSPTLGGLTAAGLAASAIVAGAAGLKPRPSQRRVECRFTGTGAATGSGGISEVGICLPLYDKFDPLNLGNTDAKMDRYTAVEIKHGRVSMIAVVGYIMPEIFRFPGCEDFKNGLGAFESIPLEGWIQLIALIGAHEVLVKPRQGGMGLYDFGQGTELLEGMSQSEIVRKQTVERNNGRLAMVAIIGLMWQDGTFGESPIAYMTKYGFWGSSVEWFVKDINICSDGLCARKEQRSRMTMRATATNQSPFIELEEFPPYEEMEMSPAVPFLRYPKVLKGWVGGEKGFDPLGVTDALPVYFVREAELKHGRVCMLATLGWIGVDLGARFPGEKFQAVASSVQAHDAMVREGQMLPLLGAIGVVELYGLWLIFNGWNCEIKRDAGDFFLGKNFLPKDPEKQNDMRLKELENGRLAMLAFSGIVTQAVLTGKSWPFF
eukprot:TRINITY_DN914_c0_g1_i9.p1 TRINITY_DN914_c0_g1~~TRINITY_DN914_c0_g1_i9.p1  ORF type:complete len:480 (-),score=111.56 TRINITY_DN914_c0_g1_i9:84-1523(-)